MRLTTAFVCLINMYCLAPVFANDSFVLFKGTEESVPKQPQAFVDSAGIVHVTFGIGTDVYYCHSQKDGFTQPKPAFSVPNMSLGMRRGPRIAASGQSIVITAIGGPQGKGKDGDLLAFHSYDYGSTWSAAIHVNDVEGAAREGLHAMASGAEGRVWCAWLDLRAKRTELYLSSSTDLGKTWSPNRSVYRSPDGNICECCHPSINTYDNQVHVLFRNSIAGNRDMYLVSSIDGGEHFGNAKRLGNDHWQLAACPMDGGMLAMDSDGAIITVWRRGGSIYTAGGKPGTETLLGKGEQAWLATTGPAKLAAWTSAREGDLVISRLDGTLPKKIADSARDPVVVANKTHFYVLWEERVGNQTTIRCAMIRLADGG